MFSHKPFTQLLTLSLCAASSLLTAAEVSEPKPCTREEAVDQSWTREFENESVIIPISETLQWVIPGVSKAELTFSKLQGDSETDSILIVGTLGGFEAKLFTLDSANVFAGTEFESDQEQIASLHNLFMTHTPEGLVNNTDLSEKEFSPLVRFQAVSESEDNIDFYGFVASKDQILAGKITAPAAYSDYLNDLLAQIELVEVAVEAEEVTE